MRSGWQALDRSMAARTAPDRVICNSHFTAGTFQASVSGSAQVNPLLSSECPGTWSPDELLEIRVS